MKKSIVLFLIVCGVLQLCKAAEKDAKEEYVASEGEKKMQRSAEPAVYWLPHEELCLAGRFAASSIQEKHGREGLLAYTRALMRLKKIDSKLSLCYREKQREVVVINSENVKESELQAALTPRESELMYVHIKNSLPSGEKVLTFKDNPKEIERWERLLPDEFFQRGHPIREKLDLSGWKSKAEENNKNAGEITRGKGTHEYQEGRIESGGWHHSAFGGGLKDKHWSHTPQFDGADGDAH